MAASLLLLPDDVSPVVSSTGLQTFAALTSTCKRLWRVSLPSASYRYDYDIGRQTAGDLLCMGCIACTEIVQATLMNLSLMIADEQC